MKLSIRRFLIERDRYAWTSVRILKETDKAILVMCEWGKIWVAKSQIRDIRLNRGVFEICIREGCSL